MDVGDQILKSEFVEIALKSDRDGLWAADSASSKRLFQFDGHYLILLVLDEVALHFLLCISQIFYHLNYLNATNDGVSAGDCGNDIASHVLYFVERLLLDVEAMHP